MKNAVTKSLVLGGISFIICSVWQGLELWLEGDVIPSISDTIMAIILIWSLFYNYCNYISKENEKSRYGEARWEKLK